MDSLTKNVMWMQKFMRMRLYKSLVNTEATRRPENIMQEVEVNFVILFMAKYAAFRKIPEKFLFLKSDS